MSRFGRRFPIHPLIQRVNFLVPVLFDPTEASITDTTVTVGCSTTSLLGTLYYYISTSASAPTASDLKDGTGATKFGNDTSVSNPQTFAVTGLSASTTYFTYFIQNDGTADSNILESGSWSTTAGGLSIPIAMHHYTKNIRAA